MHAFFLGAVSQSIMSRAAGGGGVLPPMPPYWPTGTLLLIAGDQPDSFFQSFEGTQTTVFGTPTWDRIPRFNRFHDGMIDFNANLANYIEADQDAFDFGTQPFTIEYIARRVTSTNHSGHISHGVAGDFGWNMGESFTQIGFSYSLNGTDRIFVSTGVGAASNPYHVAITRDANGVIRIFIGGVLRVTHTQTQPFHFPATRKVRIGRGFNPSSSGTEQPMRGALSQVRIIKGTALYTADFTPPEQPYAYDPRPQAPRWANPLGLGNRYHTSDILVSQNFNFLSTPQAAALGGLTNDDYSRNWFYASNANTPAGSFIRFDMGVPQVVEDARFFQSANSSHGNWFWRGSNDLVNFTQIGSEFVLGGAISQFQTQLQGNTTAYRYYDLVKGATGTVSSTPWWYEMEFRVSRLPATGGTSIFHRLGSGDRRGQIGITYSGSFTGTLDSLIDGNSTSGGVVFGETQYQSLVFDFGAPKWISAIRLRREGIAAGGPNWQWESSNDQTTWVVREFRAIPNIDVCVWRDFANTTKYRYHRLRHINGTIPADPWHEINFQIEE